MEDAMPGRTSLLESTGPAGLLQLAFGSQFDIWRAKSGASGGEVGSS